MIEKIRKACIKANWPDVPESAYKWEFENGEPTRLADVLLAIGGYGNWFIDDTGIFIRAVRKEFTYDYTSPNIKWNLTKDNLNDQSEETLEFISRLLSE